jgi:predicted N-acetyltransferase YhbS
MVTHQPDLTDDLYDDATLHREDGAWQMIFGVDTLPEFRRQGLAGALLRQAIADAKSQGRKGVVLTCKDRLVHYYASFGFRDEGICGSNHGGVRWHQMRVEF